MSMATSTHNAPLHCSQIITFHIRHFSLVCWNSTNILPHGSFINIYYYNIIIFFCFKMIMTSNPHTFYEIKISYECIQAFFSPIVTRVPIFMATEFLSLPFFNSGRILEDPFSIMGSPMPAHLCKHAFPQCIKLMCYL
jgi:hypothetical protein